jgi:hypothetical protein
MNEIQEILNFEKRMMCRASLRNPRRKVMDSGISEGRVIAKTIDDL